MSEPSLGGRILQEIEGRILSGAWPPGHRIAPEEALARDYGCSRMTVNKALTRLAARGLIERRRRLGSFVTRPHAQSAVLEIREIKAEVAALGLPYRHAILARSERPAEPAERAALGLDGPGPVLALTCRHFAGSRPFCLEERVINLAAVPGAAGADFDAEAPGSWLVTRVPWSAAEHRIRAAAAGADDAAALGCLPGAPCLVIERRTWSGDVPVTRVRLTYRAADQELVARFEPSEG